MSVSRVVAKAGDRYTRSGPGGRVDAPQRSAVPARSLWSYCSLVSPPCYTPSARSDSLLPRERALSSVIPPDCYAFPSNGTAT
jgi:hypothetical protein